MTTTQPITTSSEGSLEWLKARSAANPFGSYVFNEYTVFDLNWPWEDRSYRVVVSSEEHILAAQQATRCLLMLRAAGVTTPAQLAERLKGETSAALTTAASRTAQGSQGGGHHAQ